MATVLVADDDADIRDLVAYKLQQAGHEVVSVADGSAAVTAARDLVPDLAIIDVTMPGLSGFQVCAALRAEAATAAIPVILLSARAHAGDSVTGMTAGAVDYVTKPFSPRDLVQRVEALLASGR
ncbi:MAG TPA: response regulator [Jatrophihabitantaceae bacterium]|jgi:DNA-binding response OmpR family regulator